MLDNLVHAKRFLQWITFKRVTLFSLACIVWIFFITIFENREQFARLAEAPPTLPPQHTSVKVSSQVQRYIEGVLQSSPEIAWVMVVDADMYRNIREVVYWGARDPAVFVEIDDALARQGPKAPLLGESDEINVAIIRAINGDFACYSPPTTLIIKKLSRHTRDVCKISIPPYYGQFSGYVAIGSAEKLTLETTAEIRRRAVEISSVVYFDNFGRWGGAR